MTVHASTSGRDRLLALAVWALAAACVAGAWFADSRSGTWLFAFASVYLAVFGWNLWTDRYSHDGDTLIHAIGCNLPWLWRRR